MQLEKSHINTYDFYFIVWYKDTLDFDPRTRAGIFLKNMLLFVFISLFRIEQKNSNLKKQTDSDPKNSTKLESKLRIT